jgi:hypothetical protein
MRGHLALRQRTLSPAPLSSEWISGLVTLPKALKPPILVHSKETSSGEGMQGQSPLTGRGVALLSPLFPKRNLDHALANIAKKSSTHLFERDGLAEIIGWPPGIVQDQTRDQADARCFGTQEDEAAIGDCHVKKVLRWRAVFPPASVHGAGGSTVVSMKNLWRVKPCKDVQNGPV